ncbi:hypothetical protein ACJX0J_039467, partial [Zea mays]
MLLVIKNKPSFHVTITKNNGKKKDTVKVVFTLYIIVPAGAKTFDQNVRLIVRSTANPDLSFTLIAQDKYMDFVARVAVIETYYYMWEPHAILFRWYLFFRLFENLYDEALLNFQVHISRVKEASTFFVNSQIYRAG